MGWIGCFCCEMFVPRSRVRIFRNECTGSTPLDPKLMFWFVLYRLRAFWTVKLPYETRGKMFRTSAKVCATKLRRIISQRTHSIHHIGSKTHVLVRSIPFWCIWNHLVALRNSVQNGPNKFKSLCHEVASEFFATNVPSPPHWTLNSCFVVFPTIWVHLGPFGCLTKLSAKQAELVQMFLPRSRVGILNNERTRSTPLDPKLMFCCVSYNLGVFWTVWLPYKTRCKIGQTSANVRAMKLHQNFSQRTHPIHPHCTLNSCFGAFCTISVHLGLLSCLTKLGAKRSELVLKFVPRSCVESFYNERTRSTPLDPKLMFWC